MADDSPADDLDGLSGAHQRRAPGEGEGAELELDWLQVDDLRLVVIGLPPDSALPQLTPAEQEVVRLVLDGHSNREIALRRGASAKTVANQLGGIYQKLGVSSRYELAALIGR